MRFKQEDDHGHQARYARIDEAFRGRQAAGVAGCGSSRIDEPGEYAGCAGIGAGHAQTGAVAAGAVGGAEAVATVTCGVLGSKWRAVSWGANFGSPVPYDTMWTCRFYLQRDLPLRQTCSA